MAIVKVISDRILWEIDVTICFVIFSKELPWENWSEEVVAFVSRLPPMVDSLLLLLDTWNIVIKRHQKPLLFRSSIGCNLILAKCCLFEAFFFLLSLLFLLEILFGLRLGFFDIFLLLSYAIFLLLFGVFLGFLSLFEGTSSCFKFLGGRFHIGIGVGRVSTVGIFTIGVIVLVVGGIGLFLRLWRARSCWVLTNRLWRCLDWKLSSGLLCCDRVLTRDEDLLHLGCLLWDSPHCVKQWPHVLRHHFTLLSHLLGHHVCSLVKIHGLTLKTLDLLLGSIRIIKKLLTFLKLKKALLLVQRIKFTSLTIASNTLALCISLHVPLSVASMSWDSRHLLL